MELSDKSQFADLPDEQLVDQIRLGHDEAFAVLVNRYRQELFHYLARLTSDRAGADDLFQETFLQVHLSMDRFDTDRKFRPWLFTIATNKARDRMRRNRRRQSVSLSGHIGPNQDQEYLDLMGADMVLPPQGAQQAETRELVREMVASLPDNLREVLLLAYFHEFSYKQIAQMLGVPLGTVKSRLHTAVGTFAKRWKARFEGKD